MKNASEEILIENNKLLKEELKVLKEQTAQTKSAIAINGESQSEVNKLTIGLLDNTTKVLKDQSNILEKNKEFVKELEEYTKSIKSLLVARKAYISTKAKTTKASTTKTKKTTTKKTTTKKTEKVESDVNDLTNFLRSNDFKKIFSDIFDDLLKKSNKSASNYRLNRRNNTNTDTDTDEVAYAKSLIHSGRSKKAQARYEKIKDKLDPLGNVNLVANGFGGLTKALFKDPKMVGKVYWASLKNIGISAASFFTPNKIKEQQQTDTAANNSGQDYDKSTNVKTTKPENKSNPLGEKLDNTLKFPDKTKSKTTQSESTNSIESVEKQRDLENYRDSVIDYLKQIAENTKNLSLSRSDENGESGGYGSSDGFSALDALYAADLLQRRKDRKADLKNQQKGSRARNREARRLRNLRRARDAGKVGKTTGALAKAGRFGRLAAVATTLTAGIGTFGKSISEFTGKITSRISQTASKIFVNPFKGVSPAAAKTLSTATTAASTATKGASAATATTKGVSAATKATKLGTKATLAGIGASSLSTLGKVSKFAGKYLPVAGTVLAAGETYFNYQSGKNRAQEILGTNSKEARAATGLAQAIAGGGPAIDDKNATVADKALSIGGHALTGAGVGAGVGALVGGIIGSVIPGAGTIAGGIIGAKIGGWIGGSIAAVTASVGTERIANALYDSAEDETNKEISKIENNNRTFTDQAKRLADERIAAQKAEQAELLKAQESITGTVKETLSNTTNTINSTSTELSKAQDASNKGISTAKKIAINALKFLPFPFGAAYGLGKMVKKLISNKKEIEAEAKAEKESVDSFQQKFDFNTTKNKETGKIEFNRVVKDKDGNNVIEKINYDNLENRYHMNQAAFIGTTATGTTDLNDKITASAKIADKVKKLQAEGKAIEERDLKLAQEYNEYSKFKSDFISAKSAAEQEKIIENYSKLHSKESGNKDRNKIIGDYITSFKKSIGYDDHRRVTELEKDTTGITTKGTIAADDAKQKQSQENKKLNISVKNGEYYSDGKKLDINNLETRKEIYNSLFNNARQKTNKRTKEEREEYNNFRKKFAEAQTAVEQEKILDEYEKTSKNELVKKHISQFKSPVVSNYNKLQRAKDIANAPVKATKDESAKPTVNAGTQLSTSVKQELSKSGGEFYIKDESGNRQKLDINNLADRKQIYDIYNNKAAVVNDAGLYKRSLSNDYREQWNAEGEEYKQFKARLNNAKSAVEQEKILDEYDKKYSADDVEENSRIAKHIAGLRMYATVGVKDFKSAKDLDKTTEAIKEPVEQAEPAVIQPESKKPEESVAIQVAKKTEQSKQPEASSTPGAGASQKSVMEQQLDAYSKKLKTTEGRFTDNRTILAQSHNKILRSYDFKKDSDTAAKTEYKEYYKKLSAAKTEDEQKAIIQQFETDIQSEKIRNEYISDSINRLNSRTHYRNSIRKDEYELEQKQDAGRRALRREYLESIGAVDDFEVEAEIANKSEAELRGMIAEVKNKQTITKPTSNDIQNTDLETQKTVLTEKSIEATDRLAAELNSQKQREEQEAQSKMLKNIQLATAESARLAHQPKTVFYPTDVQNYKQ